MDITSIFYLCNYLFILTKMTNFTLHNTHLNIHLGKKNLYTRNQLESKSEELVSPVSIVWI